tara:strand:- start:472 stop:663 length:192 start_codon:yes stop_codon:yes gene_type:complete
MKGTDIFLLARICGNSVKTIMDTYERIDIRKRTKEITDQLKIGSDNAYQKMIHRVLDEVFPKN